jgi:hypothetical protein
MGLEYIGDSVEKEENPRGIEAQRHRIVGITAEVAEGR